MHYSQASGMQFFKKENETANALTAKACVIFIDCSSLSEEEKAMTPECSESDDISCKL